MSQEASLQEWKELYEAAIKIKSMQPWNYLWDMDLMIRYQSCLMCYFEDRNELTTKERQINKRAWIKISRQNEWIFFDLLKPNIFRICRIRKKICG